MEKAGVRLIRTNYSLFIRSICTCTYIIIIIIIIILIIIFMQGIYNNTPETNRVATVYSVAAVLYLQLCYM
jgi:hypothetical protein